MRRSADRCLLSPQPFSTYGDPDRRSRQLHLAIRAANAAEPITVFVALHLANELRAAGSQASDDGVDVVHCECDVTDARRFAGGCRSPPRPDGT
jgi:hypothetical protein